MTTEKTKKKKVTKLSKEDKTTAEFLTRKKREMKESKYRKKFDELYEEIQANLVNTKPTFGEKRQETSSFSSMLVYTKDASGKTDVNVYPQRNMGVAGSESKVPQIQEPIAFSKIITGASVLGGKIPDATVESDDKVYGKTAYELWRRTWMNPKANGQKTLISTFQNVLTYGWAAWRVFPRVIDTGEKIPKIFFDDIFRESLHVNRTWVGIGYNEYDNFSQMEFYYEKDMPKEKFFTMYPDAKNKKDILRFCGVSEEATDEDIEKSTTHLTISFYEDVLTNRYIIACGDFIMEDGKLPNDEGYGNIVLVQCFSEDPNDPYGVGMYELMRGNTAVYTYINSATAEQIEAEISPLLFGVNSGNGQMSYRRGPNVINPKNPGSTIDIVRTTGNVSPAVHFGKQQLERIDNNTGINNIVAGSSADSTLGGTFILAEAALKRLTIPRNSVCAGLEQDALIAHSYIRQTYSVEKIYNFIDQKQVDEFISKNPDYFLRTQEITDIDEETGLERIVGYVGMASKNLRVNFDFDEEGELIENTDPRKISSRGLFKELETRGHKSDYVYFKIDPSSMLLPSQEIEKQQYAAIFPVITNQINGIFSLRMQDPQAAASQLKALERFLKINREDIFDYISKEMYDEIVRQEIPTSQIEMQQLNQALNPEDVENTAGQEITTDGTNPLEPQSPEEVARPQGPFGSAVDASVGYTAAMNQPMMR